jgi:hypothetical protein
MLPLHTERIASDINARWEHLQGGTVKRITTLLATAAAAMALAATLAATASAGTVLCDQPVNPCNSPAEVGPAGSVLVTAQTNSKPGDGFLLTMNGNKTLRCGSSILSFKTTAKNANPLGATTEGGVNNCEHMAAPGKSCGTVSINWPKASIEATTSGGVIRVGSASEPLILSFTCDQGFGTQATCTYAAKGSVDFLYDREAATATVTNAPMVKTKQVGSALCTSEAKLSISHQVQQDYSISSAIETVLCAVAESPCSESNRLPAGSYLRTGAASGAPLRIASGAGQQLQCSYAAVSQKTLADGGAPALATEALAAIPSSTCFGFGKTSNTCSSTSMSIPTSSLEATGLGTGYARLGTASQPLTISFTCGGMPTCVYKATDTVTVTIGENGATAFNQTLTRTSGTCAATGYLTLEGRVQSDGTLAQLG